MGALALQGRLHNALESGGAVWDESRTVGRPLPYGIQLKKLKVEVAGREFAAEELLVSLRLFGFRLRAPSGLQWGENSAKRMEVATGLNPFSPTVLLKEVAVRDFGPLPLEFGQICLGLGDSPTVAGDAEAACPPQRLGNKGTEGMGRMRLAELRAGGPELVSRMTLQWREDQPMEDPPTPCPKGACVALLSVGSLFSSSPSSGDACSAVKDWSKNGGVLELDNLDVVPADGENISVVGTLALDSQYRPLAALEIRAAQLAGLLELYRRFSKSDSEGLNKAIMIFGFLGTAEENDKPMSVTLQSGKLSVSGIGLGEVPLPLICS